MAKIFSPPALRATSPSGEDEAKWSCALPDLSSPEGEVARSAGGETAFNLGHHNT
jgi:hypothetical protein